MCKDFDICKETKIITYQPPFVLAKGASPVTGACKWNLMRRWRLERDPLDKIGSALRSDFHRPALRRPSGDTRVSSCDQYCKIG